MTVSSSRTREFDIDTIVKRAYQLSGLLSVEQSTLSAGQGSFARDMLEITIDALQADGVMARSVDFYDLTLVAGTGSYTMPTYTLDVVGRGMYLPTGQTDGATPVEGVAREEYHAITNKESEGRPSRMYLHRAGGMTLYVWPVPDTAGTITLQVQKLLADNNDGGATVDLERYWVEFLIYDLAGKLALASSLPTERVSMLEGKAKERLQKAKGYSIQGKPNQFYVMHRTPWSR